MHPRVSFTNTTEVKTSLGFSTNPFSGSFQECFVFQTSEPEKLFLKKLGNNFFLFADKKYLENDKIDRSTSEKSYPRHGVMETNPLRVNFLNSRQELLIFISYDPWLRGGLYKYFLSYSLS